MARAYHEQDADMALNFNAIAILGLGSHGQAHTQNLFESRLTVTFVEVVGEKLRSMMPWLT